MDYPFNGERGRVTLMDIMHIHQVIWHLQLSFGIKIFTNQNIKIFLFSDANYKDNIEVGLSAVYYTSYNMLVMYLTYALKHTVTNLKDNI